MVVSEQSAFCNKVNNYIVLQNNDICSITFENNTVSMNTKYINYNKQQINKMNIQLYPKPYPHGL